MRIGSLFSGIGGLELGLERAGLGEVAWQVELDPAARAVLARHWPNAARHNDIGEVSGEQLGSIDVLCGGFPCQDLSVAGKGAGLAGSRSGLWFEYARLIRELRPKLVVVENVAALITRGLDVVLGDLASAGYDATWFTVRASDVGAPHRRERLFIVAYASGWSPERRGEPGDVARQARDDEGEGVQRERGRDAVGDCGEAVGDADSGRLQDVPSGAEAHEGREEHVCECRNVGDANSARLEIRRGERRDPQSQREATERAGGATVAHGDRAGCVIVEQDEQGGQGLRQGAPGDDADRRCAAVHDFPPGPEDLDGWREYLARHSNRAPTVDGKLSPVFVEALMGFPEDWTTARVKTAKGERDTNRRERLRMLGNAVVPQVAEAVGLVARWAHCRRVKMKHTLGGLT